MILPDRPRIYVAKAAVDLRWGFDRLAGVVAQQFGQSPRDGALFVFLNKARNRLKILLWDRSGFWVFAKRLEKGTFAWPRSDARSVELRSEELSILLGGFDLARVRRRAWYDREPSA